MNNKNERKSDIMAKKKTEQQENVTLNDDQLKQVWDWWEGWADKGNEPANDYERRRFQCYDSALNALAAAQKNALLRPDPANITGQLASAALARSSLAQALAALALEPSPGLVPMQALAAELGLLDQQIDALLRDGADETAAAIFADQLRPVDRQRLETLDGLEALMQTGRRAVEAAAQDAALGWQMTLVFLADLALILGFAAVTLSLSKIGRGLEGAIRLAEQMAGDEVLPAA